MLHILKKNVRNIFNIVKPKYSQPVLGRWSLEYGEKAGKRADLTNEDHCGVCDKMRADYIQKEEPKKETSK